MPAIWLNGTLVDAAEAAVPVLDHGLTVGDGVFETMRTQDGAPFAVSRHLARLRRGLAGLGLALDRSDDELRAGLRAVADALDAGSRPTKLRLTVTAGPGPLGSARTHGAQTVYVAGEPLEEWPPTTATVTVPWRRNEHSAVAGLKTTSYAENVVALAAATQRGASEALLANTAGDLSEGTGSNVFVVRDGIVRTPPLTSGCLPGITRELVLDRLDVDVREEAIAFTDLATADEVFLTSSTRDVQGVHRVDDRDLTVPGPRTASVAEAFARLAASDDDP